MQLNRLTLTQFRAFKQAEFDFTSGINLLVGANGVGKSSVLDAMRIAFSRVLPQFTASEESRLNFNQDDIMVNCSELNVELGFTTSGIPFECSVNRGKSHEVSLKPENSTILEPLKASSEQPLVLYFSTRRSMLFDKEPKAQMSAGNQSVAFVEALKPRMLRLQEFTAWWLAQETLSKEGLASAQQRLKVLQETVTRFLDWCTNLRVVRGRRITILLDKDGVTFDVLQLSDGERGVLALVLDLARRLVQANPDLDDPLSDGKAVVLIDELDLHLHPKWQRTVAKRLTETFQSCQFIATTHSPQILGEVAPESIFLLERGKQPYRPDQSLGMDTNWILRFLMDVDERDYTTKEELERITKLIEARNFPDASEAIANLRKQLGEFPELIRLQTRIDRISRLGR